MFTINFTAQEHPGFRLAPSWKSLHQLTSFELGILNSVFLPGNRRYANDLRYKNDLVHPPNDALILDNIFRQYT